MPTNRQRRLRVRQDVRVPEWALALLGGTLPVRGSPEDEEFFGWYFCGDLVPGLPDADSEAGRKLLANADQSHS
jgi:hypothetical protein